MSNRIEISVQQPDPPGAVVSAKLANGYEFNRKFGNGRDAFWFADGIREGLSLALNAIGFVPAVNNQLVEVS